MNENHKPNADAKLLLAEVLETAESTQWRVLVGKKLRIKKRLKTKTRVYIMGMETTIPNEYLNFC